MSNQRLCSPVDWANGSFCPIGIQAATEPVLLPNTEAGQSQGRVRGRFFQLVGTYQMRLPFKRLANLMHFLLNLRSYFLLEACLSELGVAKNCNAYPELHLKYLSNYLAPCFSVRQRISCLLFHYRFLLGNREIPFMEIVSGEQREIWGRIWDGKRYAVSFSYPSAAFREGDLTLNFTSHGKSLYRLCFSFIPGRVVGIDEDTVILIGGSQGTKNAQTEIREASKAFGEICPATLLLLQLMALAKSKGIRTILATSVSGHTATPVIKGDVNAVSAYDAFWESNGGVRLDWFYKLQSELIFRPSTAASSSHRARARRKQVRKMLLFGEMLTRFGAGPVTNPVSALYQSVRAERKAKALPIPG